MNDALWDELRDLEWEAADLDKNLDGGKAYYSKEEVMRDQRQINEKIL